MTDHTSEDTSRDTSKDAIPEGFTLSLALFDAVPVTLFCLSCIVFGRRIESPLFVVGAVVTFAGGALKVCWKLAIVLLKRDVSLLGRQMPYTMSLGLLAMAAGCAAAIARGRVSLAGAWAAMTSMPTAPLLLAWLACMVGMGYLAAHLDRLDARANWIEQATNALGQGCLLAALLLLP
jgi:hypothetical protein